MMHMAGYILVLVTALYILFRGFRGNELLFISVSFFLSALLLTPLDYLLGDGQDLRNLLFCGFASALAIGLGALTLHIWRKNLQK
jgi:hypothetical protein